MNEVRMKVDSCLADALEDRQTVREYIADQLFRTCLKDSDCLAVQFDYKVDGDELVVSNIEEL